MTREQLGSEFIGDITRIHGGLSKIVANQKEGNELVMAFIAAYDSGKEYGDLMSDIKNWKTWSIK